jgi:hypothetical protein
MALIAPTAVLPPWLWTTASAPRTMRAMHRAAALRALVLGATLVASLAGAATASAWTTNGPLNFTATTGAAKFGFSPGTPMTCSGANSIQGKLQASGSPYVADIRPVLTCASAGVPVPTACTALTSTSPLPAKFNATGWAGGITTGTVTGVRCTVTFLNCAVVVSGTVGATYNNTGVFTIVVAGQTLTYTSAGSGCGALALSSGIAPLTNSGGGNLVATVTSSPLPSIIHP